MYTKHRYLDTDIHVYTQEENEFVRLLQADKKYPLSEFYSEEGTVDAIINCSYFTNDYVLGRNQGDLKNDTHDQDGFYDFVFLKDGYKVGNFHSWDYQDAVAGFSVATILIENGQDTEKFSYAICSKDKITSRSPQTAICVLENGKVVFVVADGRTSQNKGLNGLELRDFMREQFPDIEFLAQLDGGGSSQMMVDGVIINKPSDGKQRPMFNGLAFISKKKDHIMFPCQEGWDSQGFHSGHKAIDIGWLLSQSKNGHTPILACFDGVVEYADFYEEVVNGKKVKPIVCIIRHDDFDPNYTYYSAYWHLSSTPKNKGDIVKMGDEIGIKGNPGYSGGVHLHFVWMRCPKGTKMPSSYEFNKYALNPIDYIEVYDHQVFESKGNYTLRRHEAPKEDIETLQKELETLKSEIASLQDKNKALLSEKEKLEQEYVQDKLRFTETLKGIKQYAESIVLLTKE